MNFSAYEELLTRDAVFLSEFVHRDVPSHTHHFFEFAYVVQGRAEHTINDRTFILSEGDYFLINRNDAHGYRSIAGEEFHIINCLFLPHFIDRTLESAASLREILEDYWLRLDAWKFSDGVTLQSYHDQDGFVGTLIRKMYAEYREKRPGYEEILRSCLVSLLVCLLRNGVEDSETDGERISRKIKEYTARHYMESVSLSALSREMNLSLTYVSLTFKKENQMSFRDYLIKVRMEKACQLLRGTEKSIAEISELVGYSDPAFFYRSFRKFLGQTPTQYRRREVETP